MSLIECVPTKRALTEHYLKQGVRFLGGRSDLSSGRIGGRAIHEQLPQRLETPIEQPGDTGNTLIFPASEQLAQRLETPVDQAVDTGNMLIFTVLAPALSLYLRNNNLSAKDQDLLKERLSKVDLPIEGEVVFIPPKNYRPQKPLEKGNRNGYRDSLENEWVKGPSRTHGEPHEWDVQLSKKGLEHFKSVRKGRDHLNVSLKGKITH